MLLVTGPIEQGEIWIYPVNGQPAIAVRQEGRNGYPVWTHDGTRVAFSTESTGGGFDLVWLSIDGIGADPEVLLDGGNGYFPWSWVPQRNELLFGQDTQAGQTRLDLWRLTGDGELGVVAQTRSDEMHAQISPNGRMVVYASRPDEQSDIWVRPYPDGTPIRVSNSGGRAPRWSHDGAELYFIEDGSLSNGRMMVAQVDTEVDFRFEAPEMLFEAPGMLFQETFDSSSGFPYVVLPDGDFILSQGIAASARNSLAAALGDHLVAIMGWRDDVR